MIHALIFDRDQTLLHFEPRALARLEQRVQVVGASIPPGATIAHWQSWNGGWPLTAEDEPRFWTQFWLALGDHYGLSTAQVEQLQDIGAFYHTSFAAYPDTLTCLGEIRRRGMRMAVLTNFELPSIDRTLDHAGIDPAWFDVLCSSAALGVGKPHPAAYQAVLERLGLPASACLFVDDLEANVAGARAVGLHAVRLDRDSPSSAPGMLRSLAELVPFLDRLNGVA
jgi:HAD superfamily hydrolase (TIGR01509 family)